MSNSDNRPVSQMRNLGPACEADFRDAGITTAAQIKELGVKDAFVKMLLGRKKNGRSAECCNAAYLYALHGAIEDIDWRAVPETKKREYKAFAAELRASGQFS